MGLFGVIILIIILISMASTMLSTDKECYELKTKFDKLENELRNISYDLFERDVKEGIFI